MSKKFVYSMLVVIIIVCLVSLNFLKGNNYSISSANFENLNTGNVIEITHREELTKIETALGNIQWKRNSYVEMAYEPDMLLLITSKENQEESIFSIWFDSSSKLEFVGKDSNFGTLEGKSAKEIIKLSNQ